MTITSTDDTTRTSAIGDAEPVSSGHMTTTAPITSAGTDTTGFDNGLRGRFNAWFFTAFDRYIAHIAGRHKRAAFADVGRGDIVELGAGVGANFDFVPARSRLIAIEPNRAMHEGLLQRAAERDVDVDLLTVAAEQIPLPGASVDDVLCSLVLCTVEDPDAVLAEARRILRPGGRFRFVEHVRANLWSPRRWLQWTLRRPWRWIYEGCDLCRDTATVIERAGFSTVDITRGRWHHSLLFPANTSIHGIAVK
jgi:SAM-dependent methyltransferase